jgi:GNAT superfamily N-acetyltransferase
MLNGFPDPEIAYLGLLLLSESFQGRGWGAEALRFAEQAARDWGCTKIRIAVIATNRSGLGFWKHCGFTELERRVSPRYSSPLVILEKPVTDQPRDVTR